MAATRWHVVHAAAATLLSLFMGSFSRNRLRTPRGVRMLVQATGVAGEFMIVAAPFRAA